jgi:hypothetical protein
MRNGHTRKLAVIISTDDLAKHRGATMADGGSTAHPGHIAYFEAASALGCGARNVAPDAVREDPPVLLQAERVVVIDAIRHIAFTHASALPTVEVLRLLAPRVYAKGAIGRAVCRPRRSTPASRWASLSCFWTPCSCRRPTWCDSTMAGDERLPDAFVEPAPRSRRGSSRICAGTDRHRALRGARRRCFLGGDAARSEPFVDPASGATRRFTVDLQGRERDLHPPVR